MLGAMQSCPKCGTRLTRYEATRQHGRERRTSEVCRNPRCRWRSSVVLPVDREQAALCAAARDPADRGRVTPPFLGDAIADELRSKPMVVVECQNHAPGSRGWYIDAAARMTGADRDRVIVGTTCPGTVEIAVPPGVERDHAEALQRFFDLNGPQSVHHVVCLMVRNAPAVRLSGGAPLDFAQGSVARRVAEVAAKIVREKMDHEIAIGVRGPIGKVRTHMTQAELAEAYGRSAPQLPRAEPVEVIKVSYAGKFLRDIDPPHQGPGWSGRI